MQESWATGCFEDGMLSTALRTEPRASAFSAKPSLSRTSRSTKAAIS